MVNSMTGFSRHECHGEAQGWVWEIRAVNGKGLDIRFKIPEGLAPHEPEFRKAAARIVSRGNIQVSLKPPINSEAQEPVLDMENLHRVMAQLQSVRNAAKKADLDLAAPTPIEILMCKSVLSMGGETQFSDDLKSQIANDFDAALQSLTHARQGEGALLKKSLKDALFRVRTQLDTAESLLEPRSVAQRDQLKTALQRIVSAEIEPDRLAQEIALILVKSDVAEEITRLQAHLESAHDLLAQKGPVGRKLEFLMQEFNREANTLCSKAGYKPLTDIGVELKIVIDQMREQVLNLE